jgi:hypothetical protein
MAGPGVKPEILPESASTVQIDTTFHRSETRISQRSQLLKSTFNRTLLIQGAG